MGQIYNILLHYRLVALLQEMRRSTRENVQKCCERLQLGYWDNGTRVKHLKGVRRLVYEARVNRGMRLLFTSVTMPSATPPHAMETCLLVWDFVDHDHVNRAKRMNLQPESGFLDMEEITAVELAGPPEHPDAQISEHGLDGAATLERILTDPHPQKVGFTEAAESVRWYELSSNIVMDETLWQEMFDSKELRDLELKLSLEQARAVVAAGPVLLRGTAGSGKTTVSVYRLARLVADHPGQSILYATYSNHLLDSVKGLWQDLQRTRRLVPDPKTVDFQTFPDLYRKISKRSDGGRGGTRDIVRYPHFERWFLEGGFNEEASFAWEEIRGIIKGACRDPRQSCLTRPQYEELGRKRAPLFTSHRPRLYKIFEKYQEWSLNNGFYDDIDLAREALRNLSSRGGGPLYGQVICDEGQDLTELEMFLLLKLLPSPSGLFFTGDPQQIVNPSGFRWAEIRSLIRKCDPRSGAPEVTGLSHNFRSVFGIVALANGLLRLQRERTGRMDDDEFQETQLQGATPVVVTGQTEEVVSKLRDFGPRCAVLTMDDESAQRVRKLIASERVFAVAESKGLEFDACVLWDMVGHDLPLWRTLLLETNECMKENAAARRALHHAYVAVTRARRYLGIYESQEEAARLWTAPALKSRLEVDTPEGLAKFMVFAASPKSWEKEGQYFLKRGRYRQAAECFRRAGQRKKEEECLALFQENVGDYRAASAWFQENGMPARAAHCLARAGDLVGAAQLYEKAGQWDQAVGLWEQVGEWGKAAAIWMKKRKPKERLRCLLEDCKKRGAWLEAAEMTAGQKKWAEAADYFQKAGHKQKAVEMSARAALQKKNYLRAGQEFASIEKWAEAMAALSKAGVDGCDLRGRCNAELAFQEGRLQDALYYFAMMGDNQRAREIELEIARRSGNWKDIVLTLESHHRFQHAFDILKKNIRDPQAVEMIDSYKAIQEKKYERAIATAESHKRLGFLKQIEFEIQQYYLEICKTGDLAKKIWIQDMQQEASLAKLRTDWLLCDEKNLLTSWILVIENICKYDQKTLQLALDLAIKYKLWKQAGQAAERLGQYDQAATFYEQAKERRSLERMLKKGVRLKAASTNDCPVVSEGQKPLPPPPAQRRKSKRTTNRSQAGWGEERTDLPVQQFLQFDQPGEN